MPKVYAGTSGWAYPAWKPSFYPPKLSSAKFLGYYASRLNSVELNYTFRRFPTEKLQIGWGEATPADFKFAVKAHQTITHIKRLRDAGESASHFIASLQALAEANKLGPILFQLPPFLKCDLPLLSDFLAALPRYVRTAFEFRHISWFSDDVFARLRVANVALCQAQSATIETPEIATADFSYLRLRKESYSVKDRESIAKKVAELVKRGDVFVYFKHEETPEGALYAESLLAETSPFNPLDKGSQ
ncbi:MAG TPA: DUF72 domain-containing protein [Candidatus Dormibacteraeota bacterium]|nr:DUF72 domain-containing protein [Candidatus Dormibacteraeota bacterium]